MTNWTWHVISAIWGVWLLYWAAMAFRVKRTIERHNGILYRLLFGACLSALILLRPLSSRLDLNSHLWQTTTALGVLTICIVLAGFAFTVWARVTLGRDWSGDVVFKQDHELIETGPYSIVRHPIYTGLIVMALGTAINYGQVIGFVLLAILLRQRLAEVPPGGTADDQALPGRLRRVQAAGSRAPSRSCFSSKSRRNLLELMLGATRHRVPQTGCHQPGAAL